MGPKERSPAATDRNAAALGDFLEHMAGSSLLPDEVAEAARLCLCDWAAVSVGARDEPAGRIVRETVAELAAPGQAHVMFGTPTAPAPAALSNGTLAHCLDFDDTYIRAATHTSAPVWAATLALGEHVGADERAMLRAFVAGFEVASRVGSGLGQAVTARGLHATGIFGRMGAAGAGAVILGLGRNRAIHALALAATQSSGLTASFGTMAKPFHAGKAAMDGVLAAQMAAKGFEGAPAVLEAGGGLDRAYIQDASRQLGRIGFDGWEILRNSFKPYAACHLTHPALDAARALDIDAESVSEVLARVGELARQVTGGTNGRPETALAAKFDLRYCTALALCGRRLDATDFEEPWRLDPEVAALSEKVAVVADPEMGFASAVLEVTTAARRTHRRAVPVAKGHPGNPIGWEEMREKFEGLVPVRLGDHSEPLFDALRGFGTGSRTGGAAPLLSLVS